jgi:DNA primase
MDEFQKKDLIESFLSDYQSKLDGGHKNVLFSECPFCGKSGFKFGIYVGPETKYKQFGSSNCFKCGTSHRTLEDTLLALRRPDLLPKETADLHSELSVDIDLFGEDEIDDGLVEIEMPEGYKRSYKESYLDKRGFDPDDYAYFPCGTNRSFIKDLADYVIFEIIDDGRKVGWVARNIKSKELIDELNARRRYQIRRYLNSTDNEFSKLLYNYDAIKSGQTRSVVLVEGCFDCIALNRKMELYDNNLIAPVATFGKKISDIQIYKLQAKGVEQVIVGYDNDHPESISKCAEILDQYFDVLIACLPNDDDAKDWDEADADVIYDVFAHGLQTIREFNLKHET